MGRVKVSMQKQGGYAAVLGLVLLTAIILSTLSLYDIGQAQSHKIRLQNAVDAATYSTADIIARDLNFIAYTNRAMVANQVAIAQMVGLSSWMHMMHQTADNLDSVATIIQFIPYVGTLIKRITSLLEKAADIAMQAVDKAAKWVIPLNRRFIDVYSEAQKRFHQSLRFGAIDVYQKVLTANDSDAKLAIITSVSSLYDYFDTYSEQISRNETPKVNGYKPEDKLDLRRYEEVADIVRTSADPFTSKRSYDWVKQKTFFTRRGSIRKYGGTEFTRSKYNNKYIWEWNAMDTVSVWYGRYSCRKFKCKWRDYEIPLGWGAGHALYKDRKTDIYNYKKYSNRSRWGNGAWRNRGSARLANIDDGDNNLAKTNSIAPFYDLTHDGLVEAGPSMIGFAVKSPKGAQQWKQTREASASFKTSKSLDIAEQGGLPKNQMVAMAKAQPYFARAVDLWPRQNNQQIEMGNLYNPFWQPRLVETTTAERSEALFFATGLNL